LWVVGVTALVQPFNLAAASEPKGTIMNLMPSLSPPIERFLYAQTPARMQLEGDRDLRAQGINCALCATVIAACTLACLATCTLQPELCPVCIEGCVEASEDVCVTCI